MNLGYCVVFDHSEQGWDGLTVVVTSADLDRAVSVVEAISSYPATHERYVQEVFDLTRLYHQKALGEVSEIEMMTLKQYSPESIEAINTASKVEYSVQAYRPDGIRAWVNRKWDLVESTITQDLKERSIARSNRKKQCKVENGN